MALAALVVGAVAASVPPASLKVLLLPMVADAVDPAIARAVDGLIASRLSEREALRIVSAADLESLVEAELLKDSVGCDDLSCSSELAGAIAADRILAGQLGRLGGQYVLSLRWLDAVYGEPLSHVSETAPNEEALTTAVPRALAQLFNEALPQDDTARREKRAPSYWDIECALATGTRSGPEPYRPVLGASARVAWGGRETSTGLYFHAVVGVDSALALGSVRTISGKLTYRRDVVAPTAELRAAIPIAQRDRTRLYAGLGAALAFERHEAALAGSESSTGTDLFAGLRFSAGLWHRWSRPLSLFGGYRLSVVFTGDGADPVSERYALGSTRDQAVMHLMELGAAWHF